MPRKNTDMSFVTQRDKLGRVVTDRYVFFDSTIEEILSNKPVWRRAKRTLHQRSAPPSEGCTYSALP